MLNGFDVSAVFDIKSDKKDNDYYTFKPSIESKEQIRLVVEQQVGDVDAKIISQLEHWWDKYQVSLHELDAQVTEAEQVMQGYLKELGYE
jgi:type I restriction enzyme M protein